MRIDLLAADTGPVGGTPEDVAEQLAKAKFEDQLAKANIPPSYVCAADLEISKGQSTRVRVPRLDLENIDFEDVVDPNNPHLIERMAFEVIFRISVTMDNRRLFEMESLRRVAPHDPTLERRGTRRRDWRVINSTK